MKRFTSIFAVLSIITLVNVASANEYTPGQVCQVTDLSTVNYYWTATSAQSNAYMICPVTRTYSSVSSATAYVTSPVDQSVSGYVNFVSLNGGYTNFNYTSTPTTGGTFAMSFAPINTNGNEGFVNFEMTVPAGGSIIGFHTN